MTAAFSAYKYLAKHTTEQAGLARNIGCYCKGLWHCEGDHVAGHASLPQTRPMTSDGKNPAMASLALR
jgi:hypothetical protein